MPSDLDQSVQFLKGVGPSRADILRRLGILNVRDLLFHLPRSFDDLSDVRTADQLVAGALQTVHGEVVEILGDELHDGRKIVRIVIADKLGRVVEGVWFNQVWMAQQFRFGKKVAFSGKPKWYKDHWQMQHPRVQALDEEQEQQTKVVPVYALTEELRADQLRHMLRQALERYAAQGGDYGAVISSQLSHKYPESLLGIHVTNAVGPRLFANERPWDMLGNQIRALPEDRLNAAIKVERNVAAHITTHLLDPQTLAYGAHDSPVAMLAWILERRRAWSDCGGDIESRFSRDHILTTMMIYWVTQSFVSSVRFYADAARYPWQPSHDRAPLFEAPAGITIFENDGASLPNEERITNYNVHFLNRRSSGGHFGPAEEPDAVIEDIRRTFRKLR